MVGAYNVSFNKRSLFIYKCSTECHGYFIRKQAWASILSQDKDIENFINQNVEKWYVNHIKRKVLQMKERDLMKMSIRKDFDFVYTISNKDKNGNPVGGVEVPGEYFNETNNINLKEEEPTQEGPDLINTSIKLNGIHSKIHHVMKKVDSQTLVNIAVSSKLQEALESNARKEQRLKQMEEREK